MIARSSTLFLGFLSIAVAFAMLLSCSPHANSGTPNIILCMADDLGWGDTGYSGHPHLKTPNLDAMAAEGIRFDRFYTAAPVCSPTRGSCLTGRFPYRYGIYGANSGHLPPQEITLAEILRQQGYTTGHFGKWHLGTLTTELHDSNRGRPGDTTHYSPPWQNGFDVCFATEAKVPTWDPMLTPDSGLSGVTAQQIPGEAYGTRYWTGPGQFETDNLAGDDARVIMDRVIPFVQRAVESGRPFFAVIWFHTPHSPVVTGNKYRDMYRDFDIERQHYYGCISAMDEQIGRLRQRLVSLRAADNTMLWFCSDNGPAGVGGGANQQPGKRQQGSSGPYRARKGSLYEGGVRVPGLLVWPAGIKRPHIVDAPASTSDYLPTILDFLGIAPPDPSRPMDGISVRPVIQGSTEKRPKGIAFQFREQLAYTGNRYKIYSKDAGRTFELYDLIADPGERYDLASSQPDRVTEMRRALQDWQASCKASLAGVDYK
jgi:arylsulfatase A-like enzyme